MGQVGTYTPQPFPLVQSLPLIAPFWADSDTRPEDGGRIWYRESNDSTLLSAIGDTIRSAFLGVDSFSPHFMFIATWDHIGYYSNNTDRVHIVWMYVHLMAIKYCCTHLCITE